jgi:hypothetical protein
MDPTGMRRDAGRRWSAPLKAANHVPVRLAKGTRLQSEAPRRQALEDSTKPTPTQSPRRTLVISALVRTIIRHQTRPAAACMPCASGQSVPVRHSRTGSLPPAPTLRGSGAQSNSAAPRWLPTLAPRLLARARDGASPMKIEITNYCVSLDHGGDYRQCHPSRRRG